MGRFGSYSAMARDATRRVLCGRLLDRSLPTETAEDARYDRVMADLPHESAQLSVTAAILIEGLRRKHCCTVIRNQCQRACNLSYLISFHRTANTLRVGAPSARNQPTSLTILATGAPKVWALAGTQSPLIVTSLISRSQHLSRLLETTR
jgi:hypothetical protein